MCSHMTEWTLKAIIKAKGSSKHKVLTQWGDHLSFSVITVAIISFTRDGAVIK